MKHPPIPKKYKFGKDLLLKPIQTLKMRTVIKRQKIWCNHHRLSYNLYCIYGPLMRLLKPQPASLLILGQLKFPYQYVRYQ